MTTSKILSLKTALRSVASAWRHWTPPRSSMKNILGTSLVLTSPFFFFFFFFFFEKDS